MTVEIVTTILWMLRKQNVALRFSIKFSYSRVLSFEGFIHFESNASSALSSIFEAKSFKYFTRVGVLIVHDNFGTKCKYIKKHL